MRTIREDLSLANEPSTERCLVRSGTDDPCHRPMEVEIGGVPFCGPCAGEQKAYFAVGELTEEPRGPRDDERLAGLLHRMRCKTRGGAARAGTPNAA